MSSPSETVLDTVKRHYNVSLTNSAVVPNPLEAASLADCWRGERTKGKSILFVGRFDKRKGGDLVLRLFANLAQDYPDLNLTMVGPDLGIKLKDNRILPFESFVSEFVSPRLRSRITFCGRLDHKELTTLRIQHCITVVASQYEIMPYAVLEPMSLGCPILATDVGGISELIGDQRNGLLVPSQDAEKMAEACKILLDDPTLAARLGRQAWEDCRKLYNPQKVANQTLTAYEAAVNTFKLRQRLDAERAGQPRMR